MKEACLHSLGQEGPTEKEMTTYSSVLAWKIPWTEEPGRLQDIIYSFYLPENLKYIQLSEDCSSQTKDFLE